MKSIATRLAGISRHAVIWTAACAASGAVSARVNDLPGGPAVNQLNLPPPVTRIAEAQSDLHWMMLIICSIILVAVLA